MFWEIVTKAFHLFHVNLKSSKLDETDPLRLKKQSQFYLIREHERLLFRCDPCQEQPGLFTASQVTVNRPKQIRSTLPELFLALTNPALRPWNIAGRAVTEPAGFNPTNLFSQVSLHPPRYARLHRTSRVLDGRYHVTGLTLRTPLMWEMQTFGRGSQAHKIQTQGPVTVPVQREKSNLFISSPNAGIGC